MTDRYDWSWWGACQETFFMHKNIPTLNKAEYVWMKYRTAISCNTKYSNAVSSIRDIEKKVDVKQSVLWHQQFRNQNTLIQLHGDGGGEGLEQPYYRFTSVPTTETPTTRCTDKNYCGCRENISPVQKMMQVCERLEFQQFCLFQTGTTVGVEKPLAIQETYGTDLQVGPAFLCHVSKERNTRARTRLDYRAFTLCI